MNQKEKPNYYAIIPANIRYDINITANAKLLYGEITCLSNKLGYCFATNRYFAELYNVSKITISKWISQLVKNKHVTIQLEYEQNSKQIKRRKIMIIPIADNVNTPISNIVNTPIKKKAKDNTTSINTINNNIYADFVICTEQFIELWESEYIPLKKRKRASLTERAIRGNLKTIEKLSNNDVETGYAILEQTLDNGWTSFYALKNNDNKGRYIKNNINDFNF